MRATFLAILVMLQGCIIYQEQRQLVSRSKSTTPTWTELPTGTWRPNGENELFVFRGVTEGDIVLGAREIETQCNEKANDELANWMQIALKRHGLMDDLDQVEQVKAAKIVNDVATAEFARYLYIQDMYFEEYALRGVDSTRNQTVFYILASIPSTTRDLALKRLASRMRQEKSNKFTQLASRIERVTPMLISNLAH